MWLQPSMSFGAPTAYTPIRLFTFDRFQALIGALTCWFIAFGRLKRQGRGTQPLPKALCTS